MTDVAVIRLKGEKITGLKPLPFGDSNVLRLGDVVLAIGSPFNLDHTVTMGIVSAKGRSNVGIVNYEDFIQTDAAINPGNSGGALINMRGELIGINTAIATQTGENAGIGFAIPINMANEIMGKLLTDGKIVRGYLGVNIQNITQDMIEPLGIKSTDGALVSNVMAGGPADKAGIKQGDVITRVNGTVVKDANQLRSTIAMLGTGKKATIAVIRDGSEKNLNVTLETLKEDQQTASAQGRQGNSGSLDGLSASPLNNQTRSQYNVPNGINGVVVTNLDADSPFSDAGLSVGDVIREVNRTPINSVSELTSMYNKAKGSVLLYVWRQGNSIYIAVRK